MVKLLEEESVVELESQPTRFVALAFDQRVMCSAHVDLDILSYVRHTGWSSVSSEGGGQVNTILIGAVEVGCVQLKARSGGYGARHSHAVGRLGEIYQGSSQSGVVCDVIMHFVQKSVERRSSQSRDAGVSEGKERLASSKKVDKG